MRSACALQVWLDVVVYLFVIKNTLGEIWTWARIRYRYGTSMPYLSNIWNMMEIVNIVPFFIALALRVTFMSRPSSLLNVAPSLADDGAPPARMGLLKAQGPPPSTRSATEATHEAQEAPRIPSRSALSCEDVPPPTPTQA